MAKLSADGTTALKPTTYSKDWHEAQVKMVTKKTTEAGGLMLSVGWKPDKGEDLDNFSWVWENVFVGGKAKSGNDLRTDGLFDHLDALLAPRDYTCCGKEDDQTPFKIEGGKYFCPHCGTQPKTVLFDPEIWVNRRARIKLDIGKDFKSDDPINEVKAIAPITVN